MAYATQAGAQAEHNRLSRRRKRAIKAAARHAKNLAEQFDAQLQLSEGEEMYACSYCHRQSTYVGSGEVRRAASDAAAAVNVDDAESLEATILALQTQLEQIKKG